MPSKLSNEDRTAILDAWKAGISPKELAVQYDVSVQTIYKTITVMNTTIEDLICDTSSAEPEAVNADEKSADANKVAYVREEFVETLQKIPEIIWNALDDQVHALNLEIEVREQRIEELKEELVQLEDKRDAIEQWMEEHT